MQSYVIGDIQGCYKGVKAALKKVRFNAGSDKLYAVGDLVARGEDSLSTMQYLIDLGDSFDTVLGNHDLHLLAIAFGIRKPKPQDNLNKLLNYQGFSKIVDYLIEKPLAIRLKPKTLITHAGLYPKWSFKQAIRYSSLVQTQLKENPEKFLVDMYGNLPNLWKEDLKSRDKSRFIVNAMTRMRYLDKQLRLEYNTKCHPDMSPRELQPWFEFNNSKLKPTQRIIFGHWASLNGIVSRQRHTKTKLFGLDTGYVWGNKLSILNLETEQITQHRA